MGTHWSFEIFEEGSPADFSKLNLRLEAQLHNFENIFSEWVPESENRSLEKTGFTQWQRPSKEFWDLLMLSEYFFRMTNGLFDPSVAKFKLEIPSPGSWSDFEVHSTVSQTFRFSKNPGRLTFGGILKGYLLGEFVFFLRNKGLKNFRINAGNGNKVLSLPHSVVFDSFSFYKQTNQIHIFHPVRGREISASWASHVRCTMTPSAHSNPSDHANLLFLGSASDVLSTIDQIEPLGPNPFPDCVLFRRP